MSPHIGSEIADRFSLESNEKCPALISSNFEVQITLNCLTSLHLTQGRIKKARGPKNLLKFNKKEIKKQISFFEKKTYKEYLQEHVLAIS